MQDPQEAQEHSCTVRYRISTDLDFDRSYLCGLCSKSTSENGFWRTGGVIYQVVLVGTAENDQKGSSTARPVRLRDEKVLHRATMLKRKMYVRHSQIHFRHCTCAAPVELQMES